MDTQFYEKLLTLSRDMAQNRELLPLLNYAMRSAIDLVDAEFGYLILVDESLNSNTINTATLLDFLTFAVSLEKTGSPHLYPETQVSKAIIERVLRSKEPLVITDAIGDKSLQTKSVNELQLRSVMCVPLLTARSFLGLIYLENRSQAQIFTQKDVIPLGYFASQAAIFIENVRLTASLEQSVQQSTRDLQTSQTNLHALMNNIPDAVWSVDKNYRLVFGNNAFKRNFELSVGMQVKEGDGLLKMMPTALSVIWRSRYDRAFSGETFIIEDSFTLSGNITHRELSISPVLRHDGSIAGAVVFSRDIQGRKQIEHALKSAKDEAEAANRAKSIFLSSMSHNLRTHMNAILGFCEVLLRDNTLTTTQRDYLGIISRNGDMLMTILNDILEMARIEAGRVSLHNMPFDLHQLLHHLEGLFAPQASQKGLEFILDYPPDLPRWIEKDESKISVCLRHLLTNAIRFTPQGKVALRVEVHYQDHQPMLFFEVHDTGIGMTAHLQSEIFKPFARVRQGEDDMEGTGLGLAITKHLVELMGGSLQLESTPNIGTNIGFWLTVTLPDDDTITKLTTAEFHVLDASDMPAMLSPQAILQLPNEWRDEFDRAVIEIDLERALAVLENIAQYNDTLAIGLSKLVRAYRFDVLQGLMKEAKRK
ncbi:MAG TPA: ATP-binding protein [Aggregatilineales bacterium]|nr:ATP-binding protein [Aggregatilineales bacterium]